MDTDLAAIFRSAYAESQGQLAILIGPNFEILMMHPGLERLWKKPPSAFFGKKCYVEMEKRDSPCPHCPGVVAMRTGKMAQGEGTAVLDDGTKVPFLLTAYPIAGPDGKSAGWVEVVENLAALREEEERIRFAVDFLKCLLETSSTSTVLRRGLDAALQLQGTESGCAFEVDSSTGTLELVAQRGVRRSDIAELSPGTVGPTATVKEHGSWLNLTLPVAYRGRPLAALVLRLSLDARIGPGSWARLEVLASILALAAVRLRTDRLRGDCGANTETILDHVAEPVFCMDHVGRITQWNWACEHLWGWALSEVIGRTAPFVQSAQEPGAFVSAVRTSAQSGSAAFTFRCQTKEAPSTELQFTAAPLRDVRGDGTAYAVFTQRQSPLSRNEEWDQLQLGMEARILAWIERCGLARFSQSECYQALRRTRGVTSPADIVPALESLASSGRISKQSPSGGSRTGRPRSPIYVVESAHPGSGETD